MTDPMEIRTDKVCDICGDVGYAKYIVTCCQCNQISEHIYCMQKLVRNDWHCEGCQASNHVLCTKRKTAEICCSDVNGTRTPVKRSSLANYEGNSEQISVDEKQHTCTQKPLCTHDCSSKMPHIGEERSSVIVSSYGMHVRQPISSSSKMAENAKVKFIPDEELLTSGVKARTSRTRQSSGAFLARANQENIIHAPVSQRTSSNISLTASSKEIPYQQKEGTKIADVQLSFSKPTSENAVNVKEENMQNYNASGKDAFGSLCKKEQLKESVGLEVYYPQLKNVIPTESKSNSDAPPLPNEERKRVTVKALGKEGFAALIKEEPVEVYDSPSNNVKLVESKCAVATPLPTIGVARNYGINKSIGNVMYSDAQFSKSGYQKKDPPSALLLVSDDKHPNQPVEEALWKGDFEVPDLVSDVCEGIQAHIPAKVSLKAYNMLKQLPERIKFKLLRRVDVWPQAFQSCPPANNDIGLYFFPGELHRSKEKYIHLLEWIDRSDLAMQSCIGDVDLLVFTSKQLLKDSQGLAMEMFLWGVFRHLKRKEQNLHEQEQFPAQTHVASMNNGCSWPNASLESNSKVKVEGMDHACSRPNLSLESSSEFNMVRGSDIERINRPIPGVDIPPGFSEPFFRNIDHEKRPDAHRKLASSALSDIPPGFSKPCTWRNGSSSSEAVAMGSTFHGEDTKCHPSPSSRVGLTMHDASPKFHRTGREHG